MTWPTPDGPQGRAGNNPTATSKTTMIVASGHHGLPPQRLLVLKRPCPTGDRTAVAVGELQLAREIRNRAAAPLQAADFSISCITIESRPNSVGIIG